MPHVPERIARCHPFALFGPTEPAQIGVIRCRTMRKVAPENTSRKHRVVAVGRGFRRWGMLRLLDRPRTRFGDGHPVARTADTRPRSRSGSSPRAALGRASARTGLGFPDRLTIEARPTTSAPSASRISITSRVDFPVVTTSSTMTIRWPGATANPRRSTISPSARSVKRKGRPRARAVS